ncbi:alanine racemase [Sagittula marina]|uniref:alanine racemase n=1 Tax=Sagittula marina TaxID=943940 RepID=UPI00160B5708|nr:alanine racemase [Sagittula marina]
MSCPRIEVDLAKIRGNTQTLVSRLGPRGIGVTGVTKAVCGNPAIAQAMLDGGALGLADARIRNVQRLRQAGMICPVTLIRTPMLSQVDEVVGFCEVSYNTESAVIAALASAAICKDKVHGIILMVEMGDLRDGIMPEDLADFAKQVMTMQGVALKGIGANFACFSGLAPTVSQMADFCDLANEIEGVCGPYLKTVSGGSSANLPWALGEHATGRVNDLRLGEAILLGVEPLSGDQIDGMHTDAFTLVAEVIETDAKPTPSPIAPIDPTREPLRIVTPSAASARMILAMGHQDTEIPGLTMPVGSTLIGATSDHLVIGTLRPLSTVGSEMRFQMNYDALMHAMAAPDIEVTLLGEPSMRPSRLPQGKVNHLALM